MWIHSIELCRHYSLLSFSLIITVKSVCGVALGFRCAVASKTSSYDDGEILVLVGARLSKVVLHTNLSQVMAKTE